MVFNPLPFVIGASQSRRRLRGAGPREASVPAARRSRRHERARNDGDAGRPRQNSPEASHGD